MISAALYVDVARGPYAAMGLDCWGVERDATTYPGAGPVIAHPPCEAWGRYAHKARTDRRHLALVAVEQVRRFGGILEHPAHSLLWREARLPWPGEMPDAWGGRSVHVAQGWWGHPAPKPTWLYFVGVELAPFPRERPVARGRVERMAKSQRHITPLGFARWLAAAEVR